MSKKLTFVVCYLLSVGWCAVYQSNNHYYEFSNNQLDFASAQTACDQRGGYLVKITTREENIFLTLNSYAGTFQHWIGLFSLFGRWRWADGSVFNINFTPWDSGYPTRTASVFAFINYQTRAWRDTDTEASKRYICEYDGVCALCNPCQHGGRCVGGGDWTEYTCQCASGYEGTNCETDIDECQTLPNICSNNGTCRNTVGSFTCSCNIGYTGNNCENDINECAVSNPCRNGATCNNTIGSYSCVCVVGYTGQSCETNIDDCTPSPCFHGQCTDAVNAYVCNCTNTGYQGLTCGNDINECVNGVHRCQNGRCENQPGNYRCMCNDDYTGRFCETKIDDCAGQLCQNNGTCIDGVNRFTCICEPGYGGPLCQDETSVCLSHPCQNEAVCQDNIGQFICLCPEGFTGVLCELDVNECNNTDVCRIDGICSNEYGGYSCHFSTDTFEQYRAESDNKYLYALIFVTLVAIISIAANVILLVYLRRKPQISTTNAATEERHYTELNFKQPESVYEN